MNEQEVLTHLQTRAPQLQAGTRSLRIGGGFLDVIGRLFGTESEALRNSIIAALRELIGVSGVDVDTVVAAAKKFYLEKTSGDNPGIPNWLESFAEAAAWMAIEWTIRRMFANAPVA